MVSSCDSEESLLASCAVQFSRVRFSSQPQLRIPPLLLPVSSRSKSQDVCALVLQAWGPGACSGRGLLLVCVCFGAKLFIELRQAEAPFQEWGRWLV